MCTLTVLSQSWTIAGMQRAMQAQFNNLIAIIAEAPK